ncbi:Putative aldehyde dehydrogenase FUS7 [Fusarium falciforme]|uniref:Putative aldehyde dehydrogenase FUS7 n=1 Tax=Fusarium falciforme TaxID=195108 RepID=UPI0023015A2E|nr:Putative aldehyde dehydrogenase FUS7 [Fusarium falciforme]WAO91816.1 Putative aldehyde dehydrogenase FUS7 [Fusarium falciforme]
MDFTTFHNIIGGKPRASDNSHSGVDPLTRTPLWPVPTASPQDVDDAVEAAQRALPAWSKMSYDERTGLLEKFADLYLSRAGDFCQLLASECGRTVENAAIEVYWAAQWIRYPSSYKLPEEQIEDDAKTAIVTCEPLGVVAAICPWNFPLMLAIGKIAPALATGNCVILKPSPFTPYTSLKLVELAQEVFPPSVIQVLSGGNDLGPALVKHPGIQKISFTGSTATGKQILKDGADTMKRITLETAGNNPAIILPDINVTATVPHISGGLWFNAGQVCIAPRRLYIHADIFDAFVEALVETTKEATKEMSKIGPVQNELQFRKLVKTLDDAKSAGHDMATGGPLAESERGGFFLRPTIIKDASPESSIISGEHFGPIVTCVRFSNADEAVHLANAGESGLAASIWTTDSTAAKALASRLDVGSVYINGPPQPDPRVPFGGHKQSGLGVEYGLQGLLSFCQTKAVYLYK